MNDYFITIYILKQEQKYAMEIFVIKDTLEKICYALEPLIAGNEKLSVIRSILTSLGRIYQGYGDRPMDKNYIVVSFFRSASTSTHLALKTVNIYQIFETLHFNPPPPSK